MNSKVDPTLQMVSLVGCPMGEVRECVSQDANQITDNRNSSRLVSCTQLSQYAAGRGNPLN